MKGIAAFMVLSLLSRGRVAWDQRQYDYPRQDASHEITQGAAPESSCPPPACPRKPTH
jgi:hypothetical protein